MTEEIDSSNPESEKNSEFLKIFENDSDFIEYLNYKILKAERSYKREWYLDGYHICKEINFQILLWTCTFIIKLAEKGKEIPFENEITEIYNNCRITAVGCLLKMKEFKIAKSLIGELEKEKLSEDNQEKFNRYSNFVSRFKRLRLLSI